MPAEMAAALANIHEDASAMKETTEEFDLVSLCATRRHVTGRR